MKYGIRFLTALLMIAAMASSSFAQMAVSSDHVRPEGLDQKGVYFGFVYSNLTDVHYKIESTFERFSGEGGTHLGMRGVTLGYVHSPEKGFGFVGGTQFLQAFNISEFGEEQMSILIPEINLTFAANRYFYVFSGINTSFWQEVEIVDRSAAMLGGQFGVGLRINPQFTINLGYYMTNVKISHSVPPDFSAQGSMQVSGLNSNLIYVF